MDLIRNGIQLTVLGARGSIPAVGKAYSLFGGDCSCYLVQAGEESIFLDAGSGMSQAPSEFPKTPVILLSHLHLDHILGLGMYPRLVKKDRKTKMYVPADSREDAVKALAGVYSPPYWPVELLQYSGDLEINNLVFPLHIGEVTVEIPVEKLKWYNPVYRRWELEHMEYTIYAGSSADNADLKTTKVTL